MIMLHYKRTYCVFNAIVTPNLHLSIRGTSGREVSGSKHKILYEYYDGGSLQPVNPCYSLRDMYSNVEIGFVMTLHQAPATIQRSWIVQDHLMLITMPEILTATELQDNDSEIWNVLDESPSSFIHLVVDMRPLRVYPSLADYMGQKSLKHPHLGWTMTIGVADQPLLRFFQTTILTSARVRYRDFESMSDALGFARTIDNALVNLPIEG